MGSSSTCKKSTEANTKVYDLNQKTMQVMDVLAEEYEILEETVKQVTHETEELDKAQKDQDRLQDELEATCESMVIASREFSNCRAPHEVTCVDLKKACEWTAELKRKADDAPERTRSHRERCRRATKEHTKSEASINHSLGCPGWFVKATANATHSLTCGVPDRVSNETKYLRGATEMNRRMAKEDSTRTFREPSLL